MSEPVQDITQILQQWSDGDEAAVDSLFPLVYDELRRLARSYLSKERSGHTLQPTALVHEAYMRLIDQTRTTWQSRVHFYAVAANMMRRILVNHARDRATEKRGGSAQRFSIENIEILPDQTAGDLLELDEALEKLKQIDERKCRVVDMRFFGGLNEAEIAEVLCVNEKTVRRDWQFAKLWLYRELSQSEHPV
jgi:RNA polymerase sigma factor (TIGR02999 family)